MAAHEATDAAMVGPTVPLDVRIGFAHAAVQWLADAQGADILHVKGAALDPTLRPGRMYSDADVLVRPAHVDTLLAELHRRGWVLMSSFAFGSSFEHSATLRHPDFGLVDLHRIYPGIGPTPEAAFAELWRERILTELGGVPCAVPPRGAQAALLLLHAARGGSDRKAALDIDSVWVSADDDLRADILVWVDRLDASLGFSVITGTLDEHADEPAYDLWRVAARGGTRFEEWQARVRAARGLRAKAGVVGRSMLVNVEHLTIVRGRPVTRREVVAEFFGRPLRGVREQLTRRRSKGSGEAE